VAGDAAAAVAAGLARKRASTSWLDGAVVTVRRAVAARSRACPREYHSSARSEKFRHSVELTKTFN
jgi:hypothetical protein